MSRLHNKSVIDFSLGLSVILAVSLHSNPDQVSAALDYFGWTYLRHVLGLTPCAPWFVLLVGVIVLIPFRRRLLSEKFPNAHFSTDARQVRKDSSVWALRGG